MGRPHGIGLCLEDLKEIEEANVYTAMAELMDGEIATEAKARLETLYKALHNNTPIGINQGLPKSRRTIGRVADSAAFTESIFSASSHYPSNDMP
jgi:hypothetical protein